MLCWGMIPGRDQFTRSTPAMRMGASVGDSLTGSFVVASKAKVMACRKSLARDAAAPLLSLMISGCVQVASGASSGRSSAVSRALSPAGIASPFPLSESSRSSDTPSRERVGSSRTFDNLCKC
jgi:hypothetical protein